MNAIERAIWMNERLDQRFRESSDLVAMNQGHARELFGIVPEDPAFQVYHEEFRYIDVELEELVALSLIKVDLERLLFGPEALLFIHPEFVLQFFRTLMMELRTVAIITGQRHDQLQRVLTNLVNSPKLEALMGTQFDDAAHQASVDSFIELVFAMTNLIHQFKPHQTDISPED